MKRRTFVQHSVMAAAAVSIIPSSSKKNNAGTKARLAFIGVGLRGQNHLGNALRRADVEVVAICDINDQMLEMATAVVKKSGKQMPQVFKGDPYAYRKLLGIKKHRRCYHRHPVGVALPHGKLTACRPALNT